MTASGYCVHHYDPSPRFHQWNCIPQSQVFACTMHDIGIATKITLFNCNGKAVLLYASESLTFTHSRPTQATSFQKEMSMHRKKLSDTCRSFVCFFYIRDSLIQRVLYRLQGWFEISRSIIMDNWTKRLDLDTHGPQWVSDISLATYVWLRVNKFGMVTLGEIPLYA